MDGHHQMRYEEHWTVLGTKLMNWWQNSINVWPNASIWMRDELRSTVKSKGRFFHVQVKVNLDVKVGNSKR